MIHEDKEQFSTLIDHVASLTGFYAPLVEKDYYLTLMLSRIQELSKNLIFKGGTCLNKIYYSYYRLSEDLDFSMALPQYQATRGERRKCIQPVKDGIERFVRQFNMKIEDSGNPGRNESKQYVYSILYDSVTTLSEQSIKFEIGLRFNPVLETEKRAVQHKFRHSFTDEPLIDGGEVQCMSLKEIVSEKLRAGATRQVIAPRDFYDIDFILRNKFDLSDKEVVTLFIKKLQEDDADTDIGKYIKNLGRSDEEIEDMRSRIEAELFDVLTPDERDNFDLDKALSRINRAMGQIKQ
jgi:predicted nucleotidyltransferase component of viral defense system